MGDGDQPSARDHSLPPDALQDLSLTHLALAILILVWGTTWAAIRIGLEGIPPFTGVSLRFAIASLAVFAAARLLGIRLQWHRRAVHLGLLNAVLSFSVSYGVVYWAEQWVPSGLAAVLFSTFPLFVAVLAHFQLPGERLTARSGAGILLGFAGVLVIYSEDLTTLAGAGALGASLVFLISPLAAAVASVGIKRWGAGIDAFTLTAAPMGLTAAIMGIVAFWFERDRPVVFDGTSIGALFYLALVGSALTFSLYFWLLSRLPATRLSLISYGVPIVAVLVGTLVLDESLTGRIGIGAGMVLAGVGLAVSSRARR